jgi:hypothetical protein
MMLLTQVGWGQVTLAGWDFSGYTSAGSSPQSPTTSGSNISIGGLTRGSALGTSGSPAGNAWGTSVSVTSPTDFSTAITANSFFSFTLKANSGYTLSLNEISAYNVRRSTTGPTSGQWQYSVDGSNFANIGSTITWGSTTTASGNSQTSISLSAISSLQSLGSAITVTFRCVFWGATGTAGGWYLNNFQSGNDFVITGTVASAATAPSAPTIASITPGNGQLTVNFTAGSDGGSAITNYKFSTDDGSNWTAVSPASTSSPVVITGLTNGTVYNVQIRAVNAVGDGAATGSTQGTPTAGTLPVSLLSFSGYKDGIRNQLRWVTSSEINNSGFQVERSSDGQSYQSIGFVNSLAIGGNSQTLLKYNFSDAQPAGIK